MFGKKSRAATDGARHPDFSYVRPEDHYLDSACQTMRPQPVIDALETYFHEYNACGERVKYAWGRRVDEAVADVRTAVLHYFDLSAKRYAVSFTLNTTYGLNLLLQQLPARYDRVVTSHHEHNSVYLTTIELARRLSVERVVLDRSADGALLYDEAQLERAVVVVNAMSNVDGSQLSNLKQLVADTHAHGGIVIIDGAQAVAHAQSLLRGVEADAYCFSAHKAYGASLGVVVARKDLLMSLEVTFIGGGMVEDVTERDYELLPEGEIHTRLEAGLQPWGEIIALGEALRWQKAFRYEGRTAEEHEAHLAQRLYDGLHGIPGLTMLGGAPAPVISVYSEQHDAHQLALFLSEAGVMVRSGYFCAHHYLKEKLALPPLLRFSIGLHATEEDIDVAVRTMTTFVKEIK